MMLADSFLERNGTLFQILAGVVTALLTALLGWWLGSRNKSSKTLDYEVLADVAILSHRPDDGALKVMYLDEEIVNPRVLRIRFKNTGTEVIRASEVLEPYILTVNARVVSMSLADQSARILDKFELTAPNPPECKVLLPFGTMNAGDHFTLQMLVDSEQRTRLIVTGRIEGQTRATEARLADEQMVSIGLIARRAWGFPFAFLAIGILTFAWAPFSAGHVIGVAAMAVGTMGFLLEWRTSAWLRTRADLARDIDLSTAD